MTYMARHGKNSECERRALRIDPATLDLDALKIFQMRQAVKCPTCDGWMRVGDAIIGADVADARECNERCMGATTGGVCECRCKGENHGGRWSA